VASTSKDQTKKPPVRCGDTPPFPKSKRTGKPCRMLPLRGASRCKFHGGKQQLEPKGGPPIKHGLYARHLTPEMLEAFKAATVDTLDPEIRLAKAKLDWAVGKWVGDPDGGVITSDGPRGTGFLPWAEVVRMHQESVAKLIESRAKHCKVDPGSRPLTTYKTWLKARQGQRPPAEETEKEKTDAVAGPAD